MEHYNEYVTALGAEDACWPSLDALRDEYLAKSVFGFNVVFTVLCAVVARPEDRLQARRRHFSVKLQWPIFFEDHVTFLYLNLT